MRDDTTPGRAYVKALVLELIDQGHTGFEVFDPGLRQYVGALGLTEGVRAWARPTAADMHARDEYLKAVGFRR